MYLPKHFEEPRVEEMGELIRAHPLATLVTLSPAGLEANHIPFNLSAEPAPYGTLRGHVARTNPLWHEHASDVEVLAIFHGPERYITPNWYPTKGEGGKVVPTWNYAVVHAYGLLRAIEDPAWIRSQLEILTQHNEAAFPQPWNVSDAPGRFVAQRISHTVGIEIVVTRLIGKWKVGQNQPARNRKGVVEGLREQGDEDAECMAQLVAERMKNKG